MPGRERCSVKGVPAVAGGWNWLSFKVPPIQTSLGFYDSHLPQHCMARLSSLPCMAPVLFPPLHTAQQLSVIFLNTPLKIN